MKKKFNLSINDKIKPFNIKLNEVDRDKSISIRAFIIAAISEGISEINHPLQSEDVFSCINSLKKLNVKIKKLDQNKFQVFGKSLGSLFAKKNTVLDFGNSGTAMRLITGLLATIPGLELKLQGDHSLSKRNMKKIFNLCELFGAEFLPANKFTLPIKMITSSIPVAIQYDPGVSAQLKSAAMLAGTNAYGISTIYDQNFSRNHTENILDKVKAIKILKQNKHNTIKVFGKKTFRAQKFEVPVDPSSAAFFVVLTILAQNSKLSINHVCLNERRIGYLKILKKAGAKIKLTKLKKVNNETIGTIDVSSSKLKPLKVNKKFYSMTYPRPLTERSSDTPIKKRKPFITAFQISGHTQFRMDVRGITVKHIDFALRDFQKRGDSVGRMDSATEAEGAWQEGNDWGVDKRKLDEMYGEAKKVKHECKIGGRNLTIWFIPMKRRGGQVVSIKTIFWSGESDPTLDC